MVDPVGHPDFRTVSRNPVPAIELANNLQDGSRAHRLNNIGIEAVVRSQVDDIVGPNLETLRRHKPDGKQNS